MIGEILEKTYFIIFGIVSAGYFLTCLVILIAEYTAFHHPNYPIKTTKDKLIEIFTLFCFSLSLGILWPLVIIFIIVYLGFNFYDYCKKK